MKNNSEKILNEESRPLMGVHSSKTDWEIINIILRAHAKQIKEELLMCLSPEGAELLEVILNSEQIFPIKSICIHYKDPNHVCAFCSQPGNERI